jgi:hypothetical protein
MFIKNYKLFESISDFDFPSFEEVSECFYDFYDEIGTSLDADKFKYGLLWWENKRIPTHRMAFESNTLILNKKLNADQIRIFNKIKSGEYLNLPYVVFTTKDPYESMFYPKQLPILVECSKLFFDLHGFRPVGNVWSEDLGDGERLFFSGKFIKCTYDTYPYWREAFESSNITPELTKHF